MDTNLIQLIEDFDSEDKCRDFLVGLRWPEGVRCPRCQSQSASQVKARGLFDCNECRHQFSVTAGSVFHDTHLPLWKWFLAVYLICESKKSISANQVKRTLGISYKTAWYLCHRIRHAMRDDSKLNGIVEVDEAFVGGSKRGKRGRGAGGKTGIVGLVERGGGAKLTTLSQMDGQHLCEFIERNLGKNVKMVISDALPAYHKVAEIVPHQTFNKSKERPTAQKHINSVENIFSLLKRSLIGAHHHVSAKHLPAYVNEVAFRFSHRKNPDLFEDTLRNLLRGDHLTFKELAA